MDRLRRDLAPCIPGGVLALVLLAVQLPADPAPGVTFSNSPYTDEGWSVLGARNLALLGRWATDELQMYLVQLPFNAAVAVVFEVLGVGIIQARALSVAASVGAVILVSAVAARRFGPAAALATGVGLALTPLFLYYGRLAYLEPVVSLLLAAGFALLLAAPGRRDVALGVAGGACLALAIGTKPSAVATALGIVAGSALTGRHGGIPVVRRSASALATVTVAGVAWVLLIGVPHRDAIEAALRFWPPQSLPANPWEAVVRVGRYVRDSDGAIGYTLPLVVGAAVGVVLAARRWRSLAPPQQMVIGAAVGWLTFGMLVIVLAAYRPNRYVFPILPALAVLTGVAGSVMLDELRTRPGARLAAIAGGIAALVVPGVMVWAGWTTSATYRAPMIQDEVAAIVDRRGAAEGGLAPLFAMRAAVPTIVSRPQLGINDGDLYGGAGVRWIIANRNDRPAWTGLHPDAWEAREVVRCYPWGRGPEACLIRVP